MASCLQVDHLTKSFGDLLLFENISFGIAEGQRIGLIAKNGAGKTTLLKILTGKETPDSGEIVYRKDIQIAYLEQNPEYPAGLTVLEACFRSENETVRLIADYEQALSSGDQRKWNDLLTRMDQLKAWDYEQRIKQILSRLNIVRFDQKVEELSGGQLKRVALANVLITEPDFLILDEPTNHLDLDMTEWLEDELSRGKLTLLMVTHDRYFLDRVCSEIIEIDNRQLYAYKGNYNYFLQKRQERIDTRNLELNRFNKLFQKELEWMRRQPQARATKAQARIDSFYELEKKVQREKTQENIRLELKTSYIGNKIFEAKHVYKSFGDIKIVEDFNYVFARYEKMGIVGNNGTGKSTFIKMLIGQELADRGTFEIGETVRFGYYSQDGLAFDEKMKVIDVIQNIAEVIDWGGGRRLTASQFLQHFLFPPEKQQNYVHQLSGGEKRRLYLCSVLIKNPNFLALDEPTNDLDILTLNILEEYLAACKACVIVASHDRYFMDKVVDHVLVFKGQGDIRDFPGNYTQYREEKERIEKKGKSKKEKEMSNPSRKSSQDSLTIKKLSFNEKRELEILEKEIPLLEMEQSQLESELSSGTLSGDALLQKSRQISRIIAELDEKTVRWIELSEKSEN
ncbi:MAG: ABC-F family ATP-binding cassette domain-containing protein [Candidatus Azobacteroides sp.]|nr:ABC-F family ATP-binding cassette domain-containing protein [Candidatus Azobacteroides sp.]